MNIPLPSRYPWVLGLLLVLAAALGGLALRLGSAALAPALVCALGLAVALGWRAQRR